MMIHVLCSFLEFTFNYNEASTNDGAMCIYCLTFYSNMICLLTYHHSNANS